MPVPRPGIMDISPYVGGEAHAEGAARQIRLASNEGALGPSPRATAAYRHIGQDLHRYPDGGSTLLRHTIARLYGLEPDQIVCGNGSDDILVLLTRAYAGPGDEILHSAHGFLVYPIAAQSVGATPVAAPEKNLTTNVDALLERVTPRTRMVFIANPNNPTGSYLPAAEIDRLHAELPTDVVLVLDAAYAEYVSRSDYEAGIALVRRAENVVMTRTFSKIYAMGGLRLGWAYGPSGITEVLNRVRGPFNVGLPAQAAGAAALEDVEFLAASRAHNEKWREWFSQEVRALGLIVHPSVANFVLISFAEQSGEKAQSETARQFLKKRGILVRQMNSYGLPDCLRVSIGREEEMRAVVSALAEFLRVL
ncbi:Histidinol-phosphate aminotransferase [Azospirillaceae bacterium]